MLVSHKMSTAFLLYHIGQRHQGEASLFFFSVCHFLYSCHYTASADIFSEAFSELLLYIHTVSIATEHCFLLLLHWPQLLHRAYYATPTLH